MRSLFLTVFLLASTALNAASITVDFEAHPDQAGELCVPACTAEPAQWVDNGFVITGRELYPFGDPGLFPGGVTGAGTGIMPAEFGSGSLLLCGGCTTYELTISRESGGVFDLLSFAVQTFFGSGGNWTVTGHLAAGGEVSTAYWPSEGVTTAVFDEAWVGLDKVTIQTADDALEYRLDNIATSVVPLPAAVWLFGSALAGLGWLRRKPGV